MECEAGRCNKTSIPQCILIVTPSLERWPTKAKEAPSPHEVRLTPLDTNPVFQNVRMKVLTVKKTLYFNNKHGYIKNNCVIFKITLSFNDFFTGTGGDDYVLSHSH